MDDFDTILDTLKASLVTIRNVQDTLDPVANMKKYDVLETSAGQVLSSIRYLVGQKEAAQNPTP